MLHKFQFFKAWIPFSVEVIEILDRTVLVHRAEGGERVPDDEGGDDECGEGCCVDTEEDD